MFLVNAMVILFNEKTTNPQKASPWLSRVLVRLICLRDHYHITDALYVSDYIFIRVVVTERDGVIGKSIGKPLRVYFGIFRWVDGDFVVSLLVGEDEKTELVSFELRQIR